MADQRQRRDSEANRDEGGADPQSDDGVDHHEIGRPEHAELARRKMAKPDRPKKSEGKEQRERRDRPEIEAKHASSPAFEGTDRTGARETHPISRNPHIPAAPRPHT